MKEIVTLGIDLGKNSIQLHGTDKNDITVLKKKISRNKLHSYIANLPNCLIGMEACGGANYWGREFLKYGHKVKLMSPQFVKPYVKSNKNDAADAEAINEAVKRPNMRYVSIKSIEGQDIQSIHRVRQRLIKNRTALSNEVRGLLMEYGIIIPRGVQNLKKIICDLVEIKEERITERMKGLLRDFLDELSFIEDRILKYDKKLKLIFEENDACKRIGKIDGVGVITATAILASVSDIGVFKNGRQFSAWLGLVPRQNSSGGKNRLLGISKRGDKYIRTLLIHGSRSVVRYSSNKNDKRSLWVKDKREKRGFNKTCVAVANKNARIIWALLSKGLEYKRAA